MLTFFLYPGTPLSWHSFILLLLLHTSPQWDPALRTPRMVLVVGARFSAPTLQHRAGPQEFLLHFVGTKCPQFGWDTWLGSSQMCPLLSSTRAKSATKNGTTLSSCMDSNLSWGKPLLPPVISQISNFLAPFFPLLQQ